MFRKTILPSIPTRYDPNIERLRNREIEEYTKFFNKKLAELFTLYGGVNYAHSFGTSSAYSVPGGSVVTTLPLDGTPVLPDSMYLSAGGLYVNYAMTVNAVVTVRHPADSPGTVLVKLFFYEDSTALFSIEDTKNMNQNWDMQVTHVVNLIPGKAYSMRISQADGASHIFDLTKSSILITQLTPDPKFII